MRIGITFDLRRDYLNAGYSKEETAELDEPETIEALEEALHSFGYETVRIGNIKNLVRQLAEGQRWDLVFNIAEGLHGLSREAQVPALLDAYAIPYTFSDPLVLSLALHKAATKRIIRDMGIPTPQFKVFQQGDTIEICEFGFPMFVKPVAEGSSKGIGSHSAVQTLEELQAACFMLLADFDQPVLVEQYLPGREFTVGIAGSGNEARVLGVMEILLNEADWAEGYSYQTKINYLEKVKYRIVTGDLREQCADVAMQVWRGLGCLDGGRIDLKMDADGIPNFLEVNPLAGLSPHYSDLPILCQLSGISYSELIRMFVDSALKKIDSGVIL